MGCRKYRNALSEAAAGTLAPERRCELDEHLAHCAKCTSRLDRLQRARTAIHRALSESAAAEPSPEWLRGIQQQLQAETASKQHRISYGVLVAAAAAVVLVVAAWALRGRFIAPSPSAQTPSAPAAATLRPKAPPATQQPEISARVKAPATPKRTLSTAPPARVRLARRRTSHPNKRFLALVKVRPEREAVVQLYDLLQSGKIDPQSLLSPEQSLDKPIVIAPLHIKPFEISPIDTSSDSGSPQRRPFGSGPSNAFEAGANKEKTP